MRTVSRSSDARTHAQDEPGVFVALSDLQPAVHAYSDVPAQEASDENDEPGRASPYVSQNPTEQN